MYLSYPRRDGSLLFFVTPAPGTLTFTLWKLTEQEVNGWGAPAMHLVLFVAVSCMQGVHLKSLKSHENVLGFLVWPRCLRTCGTREFTGVPGNFPKIGFLFHTVWFFKKLLYWDIPFHKMCPFKQSSMFRIFTGLCNITLILKSLVHYIEKLASCFQEFPKL